MLLLALKLLLAPSFVVGASLVSRRFGTRVGGVAAGLPVVAGPILLVLALDHGRAFAGDAATGALLGCVALVVFVLAYVVAASRLSWPWALLAGWGAFAAAIAALQPLHVGPLVAFALACAACAATLLVLPHRLPTGPPRPHPRWDLPLRAACAAVPVVAVTSVAHVLGPHLSGLVTAFPVIVPVLAAFTHAQQGSRAAARLLHGSTAGFLVYSLFCLTVSVGVRGLGVAIAFGLASALALAAQATVIAVARRLEPPPPAQATA